MTTRYLPSTAPGKTWAISYIKTPGRNGHWYATEGEYETERDGGGHTFTFTFFEARTKRMPVDGRATAKAKDLAYGRLVDLLKTEGLIEGKPTAQLAPKRSSAPSGSKASTTD